VGEKGHNQTLGKSGKEYPKGSPYPVGECDSTAGAAPEPPDYRRIDRSRHSRRTGRALVNPVVATIRTLRNQSDDCKAYG
jgi:hypothetical protein